MTSEVKASNRNDPTINRLVVTDYIVLEDSPAGNPSKIPSEAREMSESFLHFWVEGGNVAHIIDMKVSPGGHLENISPLRVYGGHTPFNCPGIKTVNDNSTGKIPDLVLKGGDHLAVVCA